MEHKIKKICILLLIIGGKCYPRRSKNLYNHKFSKCLSVLIPKSLRKIKKHPELKIQSNDTLIWRKKSPFPFSELILSWNASRPKTGKFTFYINVRHHGWSGWQKIAEWGKSVQKTFGNTRNRYVHTKYVRLVTKRRRIGFEYQIKVVAEKGANIRRIKALFANVSNEKRFRMQYPYTPFPSTQITGIPRQSQWHVNHKRRKDLCSPTSLSMIASYYTKKYNLPKTETTLRQKTAKLADNVHDQSLDIYGNWIFNVAQAFQLTRGNILYRVERLNNFEELYNQIKNNRPVVVSIRGHLHGGAWPYKNGHLVVVMGWDKKNQRVLCIDPAFRNKKHMLRRYRIKDFVRAWGRSRNLSYITIPQK